MMTIKKDTGSSQLWQKSVTKPDIKSKYGILSIAVRISGIYLLVGVLWILLSDKLLSITVDDKDTITFISIIKVGFMCFYQEQ